MTTAEQVIAKLEAHHLKRRTNTLYRCNSPFRPDSDSLSFALRTSECGEHGAYFDHVSHEKGSLYDLAERLGIAVTRETALDTKRAFTGLADYAAAHGVTKDVFEAANWQECEYEHRKAISISTASGTRYRFLDAERPSYKSPVGYKACWYGLKKGASLAKQKAIPLVICNGEASVVVAAHFGIPACCTTGGEKEKLSDELVTELRAHWSGEIIIAMDCDATGRAAAYGLSEQLNAKVVDLALSEHGDLADFCRLNIDASLDKLQKRAIAFPEPLSEGATEVAYITHLDALNNLQAEVMESKPIAIKPMTNPYAFLHRHGGYGRILMPGKVMYIAGYSGGGKTIMTEHGVENLLKRGIASVLYSPEWIDSQGVEYAARMVQRYSGPSYEAQMEHRLALAEKEAGAMKVSGHELEQLQPFSLALRRLREMPGKLCMLTKTGQSAQELCRNIERVCELEAECGVTIRAAFLDFAQLLWLENGKHDGRLWIESAINAFKDVCRSKNLVGFVTSQMRKDDAERARQNADLNANMMQWLSEQQANLVLMMTPMTDEHNEAKRDAHGNEFLRMRIVKDSMRGPSGEFAVAWSPQRLCILDTQFVQEKTA